MNFGDWIKSKRDAKKLTQAEVATALGYSSPQFVSNWERGLSLPPKATVEKLARIYDIADVEIKQQIVKLKVKEIESLWLG